MKLRESVLHFAPQKTCPTLMFFFPALFKTAVIGQPIATLLETVGIS